jgi:hypothetical protein
MKTPPAKPRPRTHFEQISVAEVKKIAEQQESKRGLGAPANVIAEPNARKTEPYSMPALSIDRTGQGPYRQLYGYRSVTWLATHSPE